MANRRFNVLWSPHEENRFLKYSNEICLFRVHKKQDPGSARQLSIKHQDVKLSEELMASALFVTSEISSSKAIAWCPKRDAENVIAVGQSNGHIMLINMLPSSPCNSSLLIGREFVPKADRSCNGLAWNPHDTNLLAIALDKVRNDSSLLVWDVEAQMFPFSSGPIDSSNHGSDGPALIRPSYEIGGSEVTFSIDWLRTQSKSFVTGQGQKYLRVFDMRGRPSPKQVCVTKAMLGVCTDPFSDYRLASFSEGPSALVCVWDMRSFQKPVYSMQSQRSVTSISWCPTRSDLLTVLSGDSSTLKLFDLQHLFSAPSVSHGPGLEEEIDCIVPERTVQFPKQQVSSFSWHPTKKNAILMSSVVGSLQYTTVFERIALSWSASLDLAWGCGNAMVSCSTKGKDKNSPIEDISSKMKRRAVAKYGDPSIMQQHDELKYMLDDVGLFKLWEWMQQTKTIQQQDSRKPKKFYGIKSILNDKGPNPGKDSSGQFDERIKENYLITLPLQSDKRRLSLQLCGWDPKGLSSNSDLLNKLINENEIERAAALALFNNNIQLAINILSGGKTQPTSVLTSSPRNISDPVLNAVAMALSGFSPKETMWTNMCSSLSSQLINPYLRAAFAFLTSKNNDFSLVLQETEVILQDRIGFASKYLPDNELLFYVDLLTRELIQNGSLEGLLLTGFSSEGLDLLENYVTMTSDVQTAALLVVHSRVAEVRRDKRVICWLDNYRDLLDTWRLWHQRAMLDSYIYGADSSQKVPKEVLVSCNFCGRSVSPSFFAGSGFRSSRIPGAPSSKPKTMACPNCRKPLPRCAICMINMATSSLKIQRTTSSPTANDPKTQCNPFDNWFTWCQSCRHGGHAIHMMSWFENQSQCPVTGCICRCDLQDGVSRLGVEGKNLLPHGIAELTLESI